MEKLALCEQLYNYDNDLIWWSIIIWIILTWLIIIISEDKEIVSP